MSILFHHYKELKECIYEVERIMMDGSYCYCQPQTSIEEKEERMEGHPQPLLTVVCGSIRGE